MLPVPCTWHHLRFQELVWVSLLASRLLGIKSFHPAAMWSFPFVTLTFTMARSLINSCWMITPGPHTTFPGWMMRRICCKIQKIWWQHLLVLGRLRIPLLHWRTSNSWVTRRSLLRRRLLLILQLGPAVRTKVGSGLQVSLFPPGLSCFSIMVKSTFENERRLWDLFHFREIIE